MGVRSAPPIPEGRRNVFGACLRKFRLERKISVVRMVALLQRKGWMISRESYMYIEAGSRVLADTELVLILKVLGCLLADLEEAAKRIRF